ncbi:MAG: choice-of-anchor Q domain-containing protein [Bacteroidota bacterium]
MSGLKLFYVAALAFCYSLPVTGLTTSHQRITVNSTTTLVDATAAPFNQITGGDTLFFETGAREYLLIRNFCGEPGNPVVFINLGGVVLINTDHHFGISMVNCRFIKFTGTGSADNFYGFMIRRVTSGTGIGIGNMSTDVEIDHFSLKNIPIAGIYAKTDPDCSFTNTREKFTQYNTFIHDNYIEGVGNEGLYVGSTKFSGQVVNCNGVDTLLFPALLNGVKIYNNIISYSGWDGIQVSSASANCQVYDNLILYDSQAEEPSQMSGIMLGGASKCDCFNNYIADGKGDGIESHGLGGYRIFNNIIVNAGKSYLPGDTGKMKHGIFVTDISVQQDSSFYILFNDIINPKSDGIRFSSTLSRNNLIASNVIINPGNYDYYENGQNRYSGIDSYVMITDTSADVALKNNYFARNPDSAGYSPESFALLPGSPLIDAAYADSRGVGFDFYHHTRPYGIACDIGAHEFNPAYLGISAGRTGIKSPMSLYPNPVADSFSLKFRVSAPSEVKLDIYNLSGDHTGHLNWGMKTAGTHIERILVDNYTDGIYLIILRIGNQSHSGRFIKVSR